MASKDPSELDKIEREWQLADDVFRKIVEQQLDDAKELANAQQAQQRERGFSLPLKTLQEVIREAEEREKLQAQRRSRDQADGAEA